MSETSVIAPVLSMVILCSAQGVAQDTKHTEVSLRAVAGAEVLQLQKQAK